VNHQKEVVNWGKETVYGCLTGKQINAKSGSK
jgi:hypothetical protein